MPEAAGATVSVRELTKRYGAVTAVQDVSFEVNAGEIYGLLGPNGAGKTTTLECLLGLRRPDAGQVLVDGIDTAVDATVARRRIGAQLQSAALQDRIRPREALRLFGAFHGRSPDSAALLERFGLTECAEQPFASLSGGQQRRLFLALAFVNEPAVLVLDEPTAGLDPAARRELHEAIGGLRSAGRTVLLSTHDLDEAEQLCDRIGLIDRGRMVVSAPPRELIAGARTAARITGNTARPLAADAAQLDGVLRVEMLADGWVLHTRSVAATIPPLIRLLERDRNALRDLRVRQPSLEDVFFELAGRPWERGGEATP